MYDLSLLELVLTTVGVLITLGLLSCLCCIFMKFSDLKLKKYITEMANAKGIKVDLDNLDPKYNCRSPLANENCTIMVPDVGIII